MSIQAMRWAYQQPISGKSGAARKFLLVTLGNYADEEWTCYPGQETLAADTGQSERSVREHLAWLEAEGYIEREARMRTEGRGRTSDRYHLRHDLPAESAGNSGRPTGKFRSTNRRTSPDQPANSAGEPKENPQNDPPAPARAGDALLEFPTASANGDGYMQTVLRYVEAQGVTVARGDTDRETYQALQAIADHFGPGEPTTRRLQSHVLIEHLEAYGHVLSGSARQQVQTLAGRFPVAWVHRAACEALEWGAGLDEDHRQPRAVIQYMTRVLQRWRAADAAHDPTRRRP